MGLNREQHRFSGRERLLKRISFISCNHWPWRSFASHTHTRFQLQCYATYSR